METIQALSQPGRLAAVEAADLLDTEPEEAFDRLTRLATRLVDAEMAWVSLVTDERQFLKSCLGFPDPYASLRETPVEESFCQYPVAEAEPLVIADARSHPLVQDSPAIEELGIVAYVGIPLVVSSGYVVGSFCVADPHPRQWSDGELSALEDLAAGATTEIELRTQRRKLEETRDELARRQALFQAIVENTGDLLTLMDADGTIRFANRSAERILGYERGTLTGTEGFQQIHPGDRDRVARELEAAAEQRGRSRVAEFRFRHRDGSWRHLEGVARGLPADSPVEGIVVATRDVTELRRLEERLRLLGTTVEQATEGVLVTDARLEEPGPEIVYVNPAMTELTGYSEEELMGSTPRMLQGPETDRDVLDRLRDALAEGEPFEGETVNYRKDGTPYVLNWRVAPVTDGEGEVTHYVSVQRDVTVQRRYRERLEEAVRERTADLRSARREVLERLARAAEYRDDETGRHTQRVGRLVARLARELGRPAEEVRLFEMTAPLHDLGKIGIPDRILLKEGRLTDEEFEVMKRHTLIGARLLGGGSSELARTAETIALTHHERWDGDGYPEGMAGEAIPLAGRLTAVADAFDAMAHPRPYKPAFPLQRVRTELEAGAGSQFDPDVIAAILSLGEELADFVDETGSGAR